MGIHRVVVVSLMFDHDHHTNNIYTYHIRSGFCSTGKYFQSIRPEPEMAKK